METELKDKKLQVKAIKNKVTQIVFLRNRISLLSLTVCVFLITDSQVGGGKNRNGKGACGNGTSAH